MRTRTFNFNPFGLALALILALGTACSDDDGTSSATDGAFTAGGSTLSAGTSDSDGEPQDCSEFEPEGENKPCQIVNGQDSCPEHYDCKVLDEVNGIPMGGCKWNQTTCPIAQEPETSTGVDPSGSGGSDSGGNGSGGSTTGGEDSFLEEYCANLCACKAATGEDPALCEEKCNHQDQPCEGKWALYVICLHSEPGQDFCSATACTEEFADYNTCAGQN